MKTIKFKHRKTQNKNSESNKTWEIKMPRLEMGLILL